VRLILVLSAFAVLVGCTPAARPVDAPKTDATTLPWYPETITQLTAMNREAEALFKSGKFEGVAQIITRGQPIETRLLEVPNPTLAAIEAASDLDDLYGRMLSRNQRYGWARNEFQKNVIRWKNRKAGSPDAERRWKAAVAAVAECDRHL
jgi:hypothetical protein